jgi:hypothetical protein
MDPVNGICLSQAEGANGAVVGTIETAQAEASEPRLTDRCILILEAMLANEITSERRRKSRRQIVQLVNRWHRCASYNRAFAELVRCGYLQSLSGPTGGIWMTPRGKEAAKHLPPFIS